MEIVTTTTKHRMLTKYIVRLDNGNEWGKVDVKQKKIFNSTYEFYGWKFLSVLKAFKMRTQNFSVCLSNVCLLWMLEWRMYFGIVCILARILLLSGLVLYYEWAMPPWMQRAKQLKFQMRKKASLYNCIVDTISKCA